MCADQVRVILGPGSGADADPREVSERLLLFRFASMLARPAPATRTLVALLVALYCVVDIVSVPRLLGPATDSADADIVGLLLIGAKVDALIEAGEIWRLATAPFLHAGAFHLLLNVAALYVLGSIVENSLGVVAFWLVYLLGGLAGSVASYAFSEAPSVGASGAVYALLGAAAAYGLMNRNRLPSRLKRLLVVSPVVWILLNVAVSLLVPNIDVAAHAGGLLLGALLAPLLGDRILERPPRLPRALSAALLGTTAVVVLASLSVMAPRVFGQMPRIRSGITQLSDGKIRVAVPDGWRQGSWTGRACAFHEGSRQSSAGGLAELCFEDDFGAILALVPHSDFHMEERRIVTGRPSRTPTDPYLLRLTSPRAPPVYRRRDQRQESFTILVAPGPRRHAYVLHTWSTLAPYYVPLLARLTMARFEDPPPPDAPPQE